MQNNDKQHKSVEISLYAYWLHILYTSTGQ